MNICSATIHPMLPERKGFPCYFARKGPKRRYSWRRFTTPCLRCGKRRNARQKL